MAADAAATAAEWCGRSRLSKTVDSTLLLTLPIWVGHCFPANCSATVQWELQQTSGFAYAQPTGHCILNQALEFSLTHCNHPSLG
jgi:hypothetical protein